MDLVLDVASAAVLLTKCAQTSMIPEYDIVQKSATLATILNLSRRRACSFVEFRIISPKNT